MTKFLLWLGVIRIRDNGKIRWPIHFSPLWIWKATMRHPINMIGMHGVFYRFKNRPGVIKWEEGRLLPRRWGFGFLGLIEFGDRG